MYTPFEIKKDIFYVGVNDRTKYQFENHFLLPKGVAYNSYILKDEKTVLFDTVDISYSDVFLHKIKSVLGDKPIDYLVINHMEPDHSGAIEWLVSKFPDIKIVGNSRTEDMLKGFYGITDNVIVVKDKEELSIGEKTLRFYLTPMVHWPETMITYVPELHAIFSGDAFGAFGALNGGILDTQIDPERYHGEMIRYYASVVGKYGSPVQKALEKLSEIEIEAICSTHGPVWVNRKNIENVLALYDKLSKYEADEGLVIAYGSMYGNTEQLAEIIADSAARHGVKDIVMHNVSKSSESHILRDIFKYKGLIVGSPTYNSKLYPGVESLLSALENRQMKNRIFGYFSVYAWANGAKKELKAFSEKMDFELIGEPFDMKQSLNPEAIEKAWELGRLMAERLLSEKAVYIDN
ncbi:MAG TPA: FprA family A-type flavoprotein [Porphyromonadaceae bacterium]|jgi:flavorubredoxin|nr:FprA family A-type flavoprotein [Porphyromonadaceae bacterium]